ncbi:MAG: general secretion pathway protein GspB [Candidatus Omnitrophica bacterium]|nr:general secretion pathway protein GspB [Candidatus Omnitrophota bacterium]
MKFNEFIVNIPARHEFSRLGTVKKACFLLFLPVICLIMNNTIELSFTEEERDPFVALNEQGKIAEESFDVLKLPYSVKLNGIIWKKEDSIAIINTELVQKGDTWKDLKVEEIKKDKVILKYGNFSFEIFIEKEKAKKF